MLLDYRISTYPDELTVDYPDPVDLILTVDRAPTSTKLVQCDRITVALLMGNADVAWVEEKDAGSIRARVTGGSGIGHGEGWTAKFRTTKDRDDEPGTWYDVIFTPKAPASFDGSWDLELRISGIKLNKEAGHAKLLVIEKTSTGGSTSERSITDTVQKAPREFELHSFRADPLQINNGDRPTLKWQGTRSAAYTMYWNDSKAHITPGPETPPGQWTCPDPLVKDTNFLLQGHFAQSGNTYERSLTTLVAVLTPDLVVHRLTVNGPLLAKNTVTVDGATDLNGTVKAKGTLTVAGALTAESTVTVGGDLTASRAATIDGALTAKSTGSIHGALTARSTATVGGDLTAEKNATVKGELKAQQDATVAKTLKVTGDATFGTVHAATVKVK
ncbi:hypothetical protein SAMN05216371_0529 [Streptomyces sp. TLI_053]|nr:hypothetical protein SAMN05216371_0529 [Streptomyces sp. TLI_053]